jgi:ABC-type uncharacterized transport system substrate-binding protein
MTPEYYNATLRQAVKLDGETGIATFNHEMFIAQQYAYKVAFLTDQKAVKPEITIYSNNLYSAIASGVKALVSAREQLQKAGLTAAPLGEVLQEKK